MSWRYFGNKKRNVSLYCLELTPPPNAPLWRAIGANAVFFDGKATEWRFYRDEIPGHRVKNMSEKRRSIILVAISCLPIFHCLFLHEFPANGRVFRRTCNFFSSCCLLMKKRIKPSISSKRHITARRPKTSRRLGAAFQILEARQLLAGDLLSACDVPAESNDSNIVLSSAAQIAEPSVTNSHGQASERSTAVDDDGNQIAGYFGEPFDLGISADTVVQSIFVPEQAPDTLDVSLTHRGVTYDVSLERNDQRGSAFNVLIQTADGSLVPFDAGPSEVYFGQVAGRPELSVRAMYSEGGLQGEIVDQDGRRVLQFVPVESVQQKGEEQQGEVQHYVGHSTWSHETETGETDSDEALSKDSLELIDAADDTSAETAGYEGSPSEVFVAPPVQAFPSPVVTQAASSGVVLNQVTVKRAVIGFDVTSGAFSQGYSNNMQSLINNIEFFVEDQGEGSLNTVWTRDALVEFEIGTIIVRTDPGTDPYVIDGRDETTTETLSYIRNRWNNNLDASLVPSGELQQSNHNLVHAMTRNAGSAAGWSYVGTISENSRYSVGRGGDKDFWRGVAKHEIGHTWGLGHSHGRQEQEPNGLQMGIMWNPSRHIAFNTDEASTVLAERNSSGLTDIGPLTTYNIRPRGVRDDFSVIGAGPFSLDVLDNDFDANNDGLFLTGFSDYRDLDRPTKEGGAVSVLIGAGDRGQDIVSYTPPIGFTGVDEFYYNIAQDSGGQTAWGYVTIDVQSSLIGVDTTQNLFVYDPGTLQSPVFSGATRITPDTFGDISWDMPVSASVNDAAPGSVNAFNRDQVYGSVDTTFSHKLAVGNWQVTLNMSDWSRDVDNQFVMAEGVTRLSDIDHAAGANTTQSFDVFVDDGFLDLTFGDSDTSDKLWSVNRISIQRIGDPPTRIVPNLDRYDYDPGTADSPVFDNGTAARITDETYGDIDWVGNVSSADRGSAEGNGYNRDFVSGTNDATFQHPVKPGVWNITVNMHDPTSDLDNMFLVAEGQTLLEGIDRLNAGSQPLSNGTMTRSVIVTDGVLDLTFGDADTSNKGWAVNRIVLTRIADAPIIVSGTETEFIYDAGTLTSPLFNQNGVIATRLTSQTQGDVNWSRAVDDVDRGNGNDYNRDLVFSDLDTVLYHKVGNGQWQVTLNMSDPDEDITNMFVRAEGETRLSAVNNLIGENQTLGFNVTVTDGVMDLRFGDADTVNKRWAINRLILTKVGDLPVVAGDDTYNVGEDGVLTVSAAEGLLVNDLPASDDYEINQIPVADPAHGSVFLSVDGSFTYAPNADFHGSDSFVYRVGDGNSTDTAMVTIDVTPQLDLESVQISNDPVTRDPAFGHSVIDVIRVTFDGLVSEVLPGGFAVQPISGGDGFAPQVTLSHSDGKTTATLGFSGGPSSMVHQHGSLIDGEYRLVVDGSKILDSQDQMMDADGNGTAGGTLEITDGFFAKYGDFDGDGTVGLADFAVFRSAFGNSIQDSGFDDSVDYDRSGSVGLSDFAAFRSSFGN